MQSFWTTDRALLWEYGALLITSGKRMTTWETLLSSSSYTVIHAKEYRPFREMIGLFGGNMGLFWSHPDSGWRLGRRCRRYLHTQLFILKNAGLFWEMIGLFFMEYRALLITSGKRITTWETLPSRSSYSAMNSRSRPLNTCFITASIVESSGLVCLFAYSMCVCILYVCCSVLQCVAVCCSVLQCVAVCWVYLRIQCVCVYCIYVCM